MSWVTNVILHIGLSDVELLPKVNEFFESDKIRGFVTLVVPRTYITGCCRRDETPEFKLLFSRDRNLVGVVWAKRSGVLLLLHDFTTGENWPRDEDATGEIKSDRGTRLRDRPNADIPPLEIDVSRRC